MTADFLTVLECVPGKRAVKLYRALEEKPDGYDAGYLYTPLEVPVSSLDDVADTLEALRQDARCFLIRGKLKLDAPRSSSGLVARRVRDHGDEHGAPFEEAEHWYLSIDADHSTTPFELDDRAGSVERWRATLPAGMRGAACVFQFSASQHLSLTVRGHATFWLDEPLGGATLKLWAERHGFDSTVYGAVSVLYTADPLFAEGLADPLHPRELVRLPGGVATLELTEAERCAVSSAGGATKIGTVQLGEVGDPSPEPDAIKARARVAKQLESAFAAPDGTGKRWKLCGAFGGACAKLAIPPEESCAVLEALRAGDVADHDFHAGLNWMLGAYGLADVSKALGMKEIGALIGGNAPRFEAELSRLADATAPAKEPAAPTPQPPPTTILDRLRARTDEKPQVLETGMPVFDRQLTFGGIPNNKRVVVGGAPDAGKTTLLVQWAEHMAAQGAAVAWVAVDEDIEDLDTRRVQALGCPRVQASAKLHPDLLAKAERVFGGRIFEVFENAPIDEVIKYMAATYPEKPRAVFGDSLQTICSTGSLGATNPRERIDAVIQDVKTSQLTHPCRVILTTELNRNAYRNKDQAENIDPMAAGKESGGIEYAASMFVVLRSEGNGMSSVEIPKSKFGSKKPFKLRLDFDRMHFAEVTDVATADKTLAALEGFVRCLTRERDRGGYSLGKTQLREHAHADGVCFTNGKEGEIIALGLQRGVIINNPSDDRKYTVPHGTPRLDAVSEAEYRAKRQGFEWAMKAAQKKISGPGKISGRGP